jgi:hypothetical protein
MLVRYAELSNEQIACTVVVHVALHECSEVTLMHANSILVQQYAYRTLQSKQLEQCVMS